MRRVLHQSAVGSVEILPGNEPAPRATWHGALVLVAVVVLAHLSSMLLLGIAVDAEPARWLQDVASSFALGAIVSIWAAIEAHRHGERARPWLLFLVVGAGMSFLLLAGTWLTSWI